MHPFIILPFPAIAEAVLKSKSEFSGSATIVANPLFEPLWPFPSGRTGGCRPRSGGGGGEVAQLAFEHWTRRSWSFPTPPQAQQGRGWGWSKEDWEGYQQQGLVHPGFLTPSMERGSQKRHQRRLQLFNCYLPAKPSVCPKVLIINNRKTSKTVFID